MTNQTSTLNWTAIAVVIGAVINVTGWFVVHHLTKRRERQRDLEVRMRDAGLAKSEFESILKKWLDIIEERHQTSLSSVRDKSIQEIEKSYSIVRYHFSPSAKKRLEEEWKVYKQIDKANLNGIQKRLPVTGSTIISYDEPKQVLSQPLKKMLEIIQPSGAFCVGDILPQHSHDPNNPIDYENFNLRPEDM